MRLQMGRIDAAAVFPIRMAESRIDPKSLHRINVYGTRERAILGHLCFRLTFIMTMTLIFPFVQMLSGMERQSCQLHLEVSVASLG
jgi:hypothetical protein